MENFNIFKHLADGMISEVEFGTSRALDIFIELKRMSKYIDGIVKEIQPEAMKEAEEYGKGDHSINGAVVSVRATAGRWNFDNIDEVVKLKNDLKLTEERYKTAFKNSEKMLHSVDEVTGELLELPTFTPGRDTIFLKFTK